MSRQSILFRATIFFLVMWRCYFAKENENIFRVMEKLLNKMNFRTRVHAWIPNAFVKNQYAGDDDIRSNFTLNFNFFIWFTNCYVCFLALKCFDVPLFLGFQFIWKVSGFIFKKNLLFWFIFKQNSSLVIQGKSVFLFSTWAKEKMLYFT